MLPRSDGNNCSVDVEEIATANAIEFKISMPQLRAPVALSYNISATREDGATVTRQQTLCGISVNEAPVAENDDYVINRQSAKVVVSTDLDNLLNNDYDDDDVRNSSLTINTTPVKAPLYASQFILGHDGGFLYQPAANLPVNASGFTEDSFVYSITDGIHTVEAIVNIKITDTNVRPELTQQIPDTIFASSNGLDNSHLRQVDLAQYFVDPDGDKLTFTLDETSLNFGLFISNEGVLRSDAMLDNVNQWRATVSASDGIESISANFVATVRESDSLKDIRNNNEPTAGDISNSTFSGEFEYDVSVFFDDEDILDKLTFTAVGLPSGTQIRADGVIEGVASSVNEGRWFVRVTAEDGFGGSVNDGFMLILN